jgi:hypothetical protein
MACNVFAAATPGLAWAGMKCKNCTFARNAHSAEATAVSSQPSKSITVATKDVPQWRAEQAARAKPKEFVITPGMAKGSLAHAVGEALGVKHQGRSNGMIKPIEQEHDKKETRDYHANKEANAQMARAMASMVMQGAPNSKVGSFINKKKEEAGPSSLELRLKQEEADKKKALDAEKKKAQEEVDRKAAELKRAKDEADKKAAEQAKAKDEADKKAAEQAKAKLEQAKAKQAEQERQEAAAKLAEQEAAKLAEPVAAETIAEVAAIEHAAGLTSNVCATEGESEPSPTE